MKADSLASLLPLVIVLASVFGTSARDVRKDRLNRRKCESLCRAYSSVIKAERVQGIRPDKLFLKTTLEKTLKRLSFPASIFIPIFDKHMQQMETYLARKEDTKMMCRRLRVCHTLKNKKKRKQKLKSLGAKDTCKICTSVTTILKATAELVNTTFEGAGNIAKSSCAMFAWSKVAQTKCFTIISGIETLESTLMGNLEAIQLCEILGFCGNRTNSQSCASEIGSISPWSTAMSLLKKGSRMVLTSKISTENVFKGIKDEELFLKLAECMQDVKDEAENSSRRTRRSLHQSGCLICDRLREMTSLQFKKGLMEYTQGIQDICKSVPSRKERTVCKVISKLTSTLYTVGNAILPTAACEDSICGKKEAGNRTCEICTEVQVVINKELKYAKTLFDMIVSQIQNICEVVGTAEVQQECVKISKLIDKVASSIISTFANENLCKDFGLC